MASGENQAPISPLLKLVYIEGKGRAFLASQELKGGQVVLRDSPILAYSAFPLKRPQQEGTSSHSKYCAQCYRCIEKGKSTLTCPSCSHPDDAVFCSPKCQSLALNSTHTPWVCHSLGCLRNCSLLIDQQPLERHVQARFLLAAYNLAMVSPSAFQTLVSLDSGGAQSTEQDSNAALFLHSIISSLPFPEGLSAPSVEMSAALLAKDRCNAFGLMEPFSEHGERSVRAYAIYPNASYFNHDCLPNACRFDYLDTATDGNTDMIIRMLHDVSEGQEICLSYFPANFNYSERQKRLLDDYGFACHCDRCKIEVNWSQDDGDDDDDNDDEEAMDEDACITGPEAENNSIEHEGDNDFPHAYFFMRFVCEGENCGGTLAPLPPSDGNPPDVMECNACGKFTKADAA